MNLNQLEYDQVGQNPVKIRLESISKGKLIGGYIFFLIFLIACCVAAFLSPNMFGYYKGDIYSCDREPKGREDPACFLSQEFYVSGQIPTWIGKLEGITPMNQFIAVYLEIFNLDPKDGNKTNTFDLKLSLTIKADEDKEVIQESKEHVYEVACVAGEKKCDSFFVTYLPYIHYETYYFQISLKNFDETLKYMHHGQVDVMTMNTSFSQYQIVTKTAFLIFSLLSFGFYFYQLRRARISATTLETKFVILISCSLILFNDPLYIVSIFQPSLIWTVFSVTCTTQFVLILLNFWLFSLLFYRDPSRTCVLGLIQGGYMLALFGMLAAIYVYSSYQLKYDPGYSWKEDLPEAYQVITVVVLVMLGLLVLWMLILIWRALPTLCNAPKRQQFLIIINTIMIVFTFSGLVIGFYQPLPNIGAMFLIVITIYNVYVYILQWLLVPTDEGVESLTGGMPGSSDGGNVEMEKTGQVKE